MLRRAGLIVCLLVSPWMSTVLADGGGGGKPLTRAEVTQVKRMLVDVVNALGNPPAGYDKLTEDFDLPTEYQPHQADRRFMPLYPAVRLRFGSDTRKAEKSAEEAAQEFQRKYIEASTAGDAEAVTRLTQEYQRMMGDIQVKAMAAKTTRPIDITVRANVFQAAVIDPDGVIFEKPGVIALTEKSDRQDTAKVSIYYDPVGLKETKTLSKVAFDYPENGLPAKTTVGNIVIEMQGPEALIHQWAKRIDGAAVLAKIK